MNDFNGNEEFIAEREIQAILKSRDNSEAATQLAEIRAISNVRQALENLIVQCKASEKFQEIETFAEDALSSLEYELRVKIHA